MEEENEEKRNSIKQYGVLFASEFIGTAILMYVGCFGTALEAYKHMQPLIVASTFAMGIMASVQAFGHVSGAHINPGVTLGIFILGKIDWKKMLVFWVAQYTGAFFGYGLLWIQMPASSVDLKPCALSVRPFLTPIKVFFLEFTASGVLFLAVGGAIDNCNGQKEDSLVLRLGFIIFGLIVAVAELSGACLNSARALPSAVFNNVYDSHWVFHLGPVLGQCAGAVVYKFLFDTSDKLSLNRRKQKS